MFNTWPSSDCFTHVPWWTLLPLFAAGMEASEGTLPSPTPLAGTRSVDVGVEIPCVSAFLAQRLPRICFCSKAHETRPFKIPVELC